MLCSKDSPGTPRTISSKAFLYLIASLCALQGKSDYRANWLRPSGPTCRTWAKKAAHCLDSSSRLELPSCALRVRFLKPHPPSPVVRNFGRVKRKNRDVARKGVFYRVTYRLRTILYTGGQSVEGSRV